MDGNDVPARVRGTADPLQLTVADQVLASLQSGGKAPRIAVRAKAIVRHDRSIHFTHEVANGRVHPECMAPDKGFVPLIVRNNALSVTRRSWISFATLPEPCIKQAWCQAPWGQ